MTMRISLLTMFALTCVAAVACGRTGLEPGPSPNPGADDDSGAGAESGTGGGSGAGKGGGAGGTSGSGGDIGNAGGATGTGAGAGGTVTVGTGGTGTGAGGTVGAGAAAGSGTGGKVGTGAAAGSGTSGTVGAGGAPGLGGGGTDGSTGPGPVLYTGCSTPGALDCSSQNPRVRLLCDGMTWNPIAVCTGSLVCDTNPGPNHGQCTVSDAGTPPPLSGEDPTGTGVVLYTACSTLGDLDCNIANPKIQVLCDGQTWDPIGVCMGTQVCDTQPGPNQGLCKTP